MKTTTFSRHLSMLGAWALAFGCSVGSDAFVMPWNDFLPKAGPFGTVFGIFIGGLIMTIVAWNFHYMINRQPGSGGTYAYASKTFGHDHGFLCGVFLAFAYLAIVWLDVTALVVVAHYTLGDTFRFGFRYTIQGSSIYLGDFLLSIAAIIVASVICCRRRLSGVVQSVLAVILAAGILACFASAAINHHGGLESMRPFFAPDRGSGLLQTLNILAIAPWLFVGFEAISNSSSEFRFPIGKSFWVMLAALVTAVIAYMCLTTIPVLTLGEEASGWTGAVASLANSGAEPDFHAFDVASQFFGKAGGIIIGVTLVGAIFTNLVGNTVAASRLMAAMADDGALPAFLGGRNADGAPHNAVVAIAALATLVVPLGRAVIGVVVDISILGAAVAYAYTSSAALKTACKAGDRGTQVTGLLGLLFSIVVIVLFVMPFMTFDATMIATESYLVLIGWCLAALAIFITIFHRDSMRRFGRSSVAWISLFVIIMILSVVWIRQTTRETTEKAYETIVGRHAETCTDAALGKARHGQENGDWHVVLRKNLSNVERSIFRSNLVQTGLNLLAISLMFGLYAILRRRERDMEREKATAKSYFFSTVSHDIRTPLNAIIGYSTMLESGFKTEAERKEAIDSIIMSGKTLLGLVNDVLDLSKLESGKMEVLPEPTDCSRLMRVVMEAFRASSGGLGFELRCRAEEMPLLMLDPQRLRQIVFNLVGNAVKFTEKGYVELRARFERRKDAGVLRLEVEDTGCGISEEDLKRIGSAYSQVGVKASRNGGTGLGLAICKQLAAAMGGRLEVSSTLGAGSTFSVVIPNVKIAESTADAQKHVPPLADAQQSALPGRMPHRILLVDDSKVNLMVLKALLKNMGDFEIAMAADGQEALSMLKAPDAKAFDLVLTDMWMPNLDGAGLIRAIRTNPALASLRVVAVTADVESQATYADMGFDGILLKPVTPATLGKALSEDP